ncbi:hypothetical protein RISK_004183 [Rhodopirellula islandica]|uniref:Uncharacterized protein n=1 Tax=Rhodopirellula islandica TaxID=595434 RepID=A0A0J1BB68_RHOIS|nr:hypothetical protein RISK_004183 [Rhodopirellula islandica]
MEQEEKQNLATPKTQNGSPPRSRPRIPSSVDNLSGKIRSFRVHHSL